MDSKTLSVLEWPKLVELLVAEAATSVGKDRCQAIDFHTDLEGVSHALRLTTEADELIRLTGGFPLGGIRDIRQPLRRVEQGADLDGPDLLAIADTMDAARRIKAFMGEHAEEVPAFAELAAPLTPLPKLVAEIKRCFDQSGEVTDDASPALQTIRQRIRQAQSGIREKLQRMLHTHAQYLQESLITVRGDRFVLPVRADAKSQVPGLVHDQSASGSTLYIEPMAVVELNNSLQKAKLDERDEIARILERLTQLVMADLEEIHWTLDALAEIDFTVAKARLSRKLDARAPRLSRDGFTRLYSARHPLLAAQEAEGTGHKVVPIDIEVGGQAPVLLITGPNTGGKTVTLKTLGLITLMTQAGLHAPVADGSVVGLAKAVYADIGDEQSLAQSLSTFSGHMTNIIRILGKADRKSLVLLDEIGAGTDPQEGAVLARAIIEEFLHRGTRLVATTHYGELKLMAYETPGVRNASVEFDAASLRPTYRLLMGVPGQSNALLIASRLGLPEEIVKRSEELLQSSKNDSARIIGELETEQHQAAVARREAEAARAEATRLREMYQAKLERWNETLHSLREKARLEIERELKAAREEITEVIRELQGGKSSAAAQKARDRIDRIAAAKAKAKAEKPKVREVMIGETVFLPRLNQTGVVQTAPDANGEVILQVGIMRVTAKVSELSPAKDAPKVPSRPASKIKVPAPSYGKAPASTREASLECDLRGMQAHEAIGEAETFLDTALSHDIKVVTLIHGGGTGALRKAIREYLRESPYVASFRAGGQGEGGDGVTIVTLR